MALEIQIHSVQARILRTLLFNPTARFTQLNSEKLSNDHFSFHINKLVELGMLEKLTRGEYQLTTKGKEFANRMDTETAKLERQAKIGVAVVAVKKEGKETRYLAQKRLKQPYFGFWGFVTGKVRWGDTAEETAGRELAEETGLAAKEIIMTGIEHKLDNAENGDVLEDKFFLIFKAGGLSGRLKEKFEGGENRWLTRDEILALPDLFPDVPLFLEIITGKQIKIVEKRYTIKKY